MNRMSLEVSQKTTNESGGGASLDQPWEKEWGSFLCTGMERSAKYVIKRGEPQGVGQCE